MEGLSKDVGDIKHNELLMLKHLNLPRLSPLSPTRRHRLFQLSLLFCLRLIILLSRITRTSRCWDFQYRIKTISAYLKQIFPPTSCIFIIISLDTMSQLAKHIEQTSSVMSPPSLLFGLYPENCSAATLYNCHTRSSVS